MERPTQFGPYLLLERISLGGMAEVFKAKEFGVDGFERIVAVKRILPHVAEDEEFIGMFKDEARIAVQLTHSNIAQIYSLGQEDDSFYIALEYVAGKDLRTIFETVRSAGEVLSAAQACFVVMKVCEGLDYAHNKKDRFGNALNLIHRDVSPPNILVSYEGEVKLIDFGVVKAAGRSSNTKSGILKGKFGYMAPEQVRGQPVDRRGDIFALGACLWEILTSTRLFQGDSDFATLEMVRAGRIRSPREVNPDIPARLADIVLKALAPEPSERYSSAMEFHDDLQAFMFSDGLFYSRKNLAAWMRQKYRTDIELEKEKAKKQAIDTRRQQRAKLGTMVMGAGGAPPPPPPRGKSTPGSGAHPPPRRSRTDTMQMSPTRPPSLEPAPPPRPPTRTPTRSPVMASAARSAPPPPASYDAPPKADAELDWDDDELETRLFVGGEGAEMAATNRANDMASVRRGVDPAPAAAAPPPAASRANTMPAAPPVAMSPTLAPPVVAGRGMPTNAPAPAPHAARPQPGPLYPSILSEPDLPSRGGSRWILWAVILLAVIGGGGFFVFSSGKSDRAGESGVDVGADAGALKLELSHPDAIVKIDGVAVAGVGTPRVIDKLSPGQHRLSVVQSGFLAYESTVQVKAGVIGSVPIKLEPSQITLAIQTTPPEAQVALVVDGQSTDIGQGSFNYQLTRQPGVTYNLVAQAPGYLAMTMPLALDGSNPQPVALQLLPDPDADEEDEETAEPVGSKSEDTTSRRRRPKRSSSSSSSSSSSASSGGAKTAELKIGTEPGLPPAAVYIDGAKASSRTPLKVKVRPGSYTIEWRWPDGKQHQRKVTVDDGQSKLVKGRQ